MWKGYEESLKLYYNIFLDVCKTDLKVNTQLPTLKNGEIISPWWLGDENFHGAMRARLYSKNPELYKIFVDDKDTNGGMYLWPNNQTKTFKTI